MKSDFLHRRRGDTVSSSTETMEIYVWATLIAMASTKTFRLGELLLLVTIDETCKQLGIEDFATVGAILAGQNWVPTRGKFHGRHAATLRGLKTRANLPELRSGSAKILPTVTNASVRQLKVFMTRIPGTL